MEALILALAAGLDAIGIGGWVRGPANVYPWANVTHVLGVVALVGSIGIVDLRLSGVWRAIPAKPLADALTPVAIAAFIVMIASGMLLLAADAPTLARSGAFQLKLGLIAAASANAALFRWRAGRMGSAATAALAILSLGLWTAIIVAGRMIAYS